LQANYSPPQDKIMPPKCEQAAEKPGERQAPDATDCPSVSPTDVKAARAAAANNLEGGAAAREVVPAKIEADGIAFPPTAAENYQKVLAAKVEPGDIPPNHYVQAAEQMASQQGHGFSARAVRLALEAAGETGVPRGNAAAMGAALLERGDRYKISFEPGKGQPGDILVRPPGSGNSAPHGDIMMITGSNPDGSLRAASDRTISRVQPDDGVRFRDSYLLRRRPG
jgi:hypothetical protein